MQQFYNSKKGVIIIFTVAVLLRIGIVSTNLHHADMKLFREWGVKANVHGIASLYDHVNHYKPSVYVPFILYASWIMDNIGNGLKQITGPFDFFMWQFKFLILLFDILIAFILYRKLKSGSMAPASAALFLFNPAILFCGVLWGQIDNIYVAFIVFSLLCIFRAKVILAGIFFSLACMTKLQTIIYVPLMFVVLFSTCHFRQILKFLAAFLIMAALFYLPFILTGKLLVALKLFTGAASRYPVYSMNAFNLWWLLGIGNGSIPDAAPVLPFLPAKTAGLVLFCAGYLMAVFSLLSRFSKQHAFFIFAFVSMSFFMLPTQMHERYLFPFFVFILFVPLTASRDRILYDGLSISFFVNLLAVFMIHKRYTNFISTHFLLISVLISLFHLAAFIFLSSRVLRDTRFSSFWNFCRERLLK